MALELIITGCLREIGSRLSDAATISKAAIVCAENGAEREALRIAMDFDELMNEAQTLHSAMCLYGRLARREAADP